jgi:hypothetical protein
MMRVARPIFLMSLVAALTVYTFDCFRASTPDEAMECCDRMPCPEHSHDGSQDCCQTMQSLHVPFMQPHSVDHTSHALMFHAMLPGTDAFKSLDSSAHIPLIANSHAPPAVPTSAATPLRI